jgi:hypothetical protein
MSRPRPTRRRRSTSRPRPRSTWTARAPATCSSTGSKCKRARPRACERALHAKVSASVAAGAAALQGDAVLLGGRRGTPRRLYGQGSAWRGQLVDQAQRATRSVEVQRAVARRRACARAQELLRGHARGRQPHQLAVGAGHAARPARAQRARGAPGRRAARRRRVAGPGHLLHPARHERGRRARAHAQLLALRAVRSPGDPAPWLQVMSPQLAIGRHARRACWPQHRLVLWPRHLHQAAGRRWMTQIWVTRGCL